MELKLLEKALRKSWNKGTCYPPFEAKWRKSDPAYGQCYGTALVVHDYFGGWILKVKFQDGTGHFWNLVKGKEVDLTKSQFGRGQLLPPPKRVFRPLLERSPGYAESNRRYRILKRRVQEFLRKEHPPHGPQKA